MKTPTQSQEDLAKEEKIKKWREIQDLFREVRPGYSVSEELIRERHEEAEREGY